MFPGAEVLNLGAKALSANADGAMASNASIAAATVAARRKVVGVDGIRKG